jgi:hypothetical protein
MNPLLIHSKSYTDLIGLTHSSNLNIKDLFEMIQRRIRENSWIVSRSTMFAVLSSEYRLGGCFVSPSPTGSNSSSFAIPQIVFKALITVHTLMREGSGDKIIAFVEQHPTILDVSRLKEKGGGKC